MRVANRNLFVIVGGVAWVSAVLVGMALLWQYALSPGTPATPPDAWPVMSAIPRKADRHTLAVFFHPHCPCTDASLEELIEIATRTSSRVEIRVVFVVPEGLNEDWALTPLRQNARRIPGVSITTDLGGREARLFGAVTSGEALLFDAAGRLVFSGGITPARGHAGDNDGRRAIVALVNSSSGTAPSTPVYGCPLLDAHSDCEENLCHHQ